MLGVWLFKETYYRANTGNDPNAALNLAMCYGYGIGTRPEWAKCVEWVKRAASLESGAGILFLKRMCPDIKHLEIPNKSPEGSEEVISIPESLVTLCARRIPQCPTEALQIIQLLQQTERLSWTLKHLETGNWCCCDEIREGGFIAVIKHLWRHVESGVLKPDFGLTLLLTAFSDVIDQDGRTLMHILATCFHPSLMDAELRLSERMAEILLEHGCPINDPDTKGATPLQLALEGGNVRLVEFLLMHGANLDVEEAWRMLDIIVDEFNYELLSKVLLHFTHLNDDFTTRFKTLIKRFLRRPLVERKLLHGYTYEERATKVLVLLWDYGMKNGYDWLSDTKCHLEYTALSGSEDLLSYFANKLPSENQANCLKNIIDETDLLYGSILRMHRNIFLQLLRFGADIYLLGTNGSRSPVYAAAVVFELDAFFLEELLLRGLDLSRTKNRGASAVFELVRRKNSAGMVARLLSQFPYLRDLRSGNIDLLSWAVVYGFPETVQVIIDAGVRITELKLEDAVRFPRRVCLQNLRVLTGQLSADESKSTEILASALAVACLWGNLEAVIILLEAGANPNIEYNGGSAKISAYLRRARFEGSEGLMKTVEAHFEDIKWRQTMALLRMYGLME